MNLEEEVEDDQDPVQQHIEIHRRRIGLILERLLEKLTISICIERLLHDYNLLLSEILTPRQMICLHESQSRVNKTLSFAISNKGTNSKSITSTSNSSILARKSMKVEQEYNKDMCLSNIIGILHHNDEIMSIVREIYSSKRGPAVDFISQMQELKNYIMELLYTTATQERIHNKRLGNAWINNERYKKKIIEMEMSHAVRSKELMSKVNEKNEIIYNFKEQIALSKEKCMTDIVTVIKDSETNMARTTTQSEENREYLSEEAKQVMQQYQTLLENHLAHEKQMRIKRYKVETVLAGWIAKYDEGIGDLQAVMEVQQNGFNDEKEAFDDLTLRSEKQLEEFTFLMNEKAENERLEHEYAVYLFMVNYCARKIQRWFRHFLMLWEKRRKKAAKAARNRK